VTGTSSGVGAPRYSTLSDVNSRLATSGGRPSSFDVPSRPTIPRDRYSASAPTAPSCIPVSAPDSQSVSTDSFSPDSHQSSMVTSQLSAQTEPFYPVILDGTPLSTAQPALFTHTFTAESADVDQTLVKSALNDELPEHVNLLFIQTTTEQNLPPDIVDGLKQLLHDHANTFSKSSADLGFCDILQHDIDTDDSPPIKQPPKRPPLAAAAAEDEILEEMLSTGVIEPSHSPWASHVCLVRKKEGTYRFCVDYRRVNAVSRKDAFPVSDIHDALDHLRGQSTWLRLTS